MNLEQAKAIVDKCRAAQSRAYTPRADQGLEDAVCEAEGMVSAIRKGKSDDRIDGYIYEIRMCVEYADRKDESLDVAPLLSMLD